ncbi:protein EMSY-LIKE 3 isoform X3 [Malania oleifera]|uniref:protein EMSY-LIKE 3 isoform X3 n=1 Tax=Malania oleifera TaxID=397392 RepID=UPI0025AE8EFE|nr:protein EMSY-LIKE 3 isoform X3 [Malania oleifera]
MRSMDYGLSDSSGTDDDLPPTHQNRFQRGGRAAGNGRSGVAGSAPFLRVQNDMETQIHNIEQDAYSSVLRAFKAQSDAISWEKESLITELRRELRVSDEEHRELLSRVNADDIIRRIREWRKAGGLQPGMLSGNQPVHDPVPSPTVSASRKKQRTSHSVASLSLSAAPPALQQNLQPSSSAFKQGPAPGARGKKPKSTLSAASSMKSTQYPSTGLTGRAQIANRGSSGPFVGNEPTEAANFDPLVGRKVWTRWPEDNNFYEAVITDYKEGRHALVYDINTENETWEWVNLKEISPEDIRWEGEDPRIPHRGGRGGPGRGMKKSMTRGGGVAGAGRGRGTTKGQPKKDFAPSQNGIGKKVPGDIEILHTDTLIKEVEKVFSSSHPDSVEIEKVKKVLKEHEQALVDAIARLEDASDGESDEREPPFSQGQSLDQERGWRKRQYDEMGEGRLIDGPDRPGDGRLVSDDARGGNEI